MIIDILVEGPTDEAAAKKIIAACNHEFGTAYGKKGQAYLRLKAAGFNVRAKYGNPILTLVDFMDTGLDCPPEVPPNWLPERSEKMLVRVVVHELESWLLADAVGIARFLGISQTVIPRNPEVLTDPKQAFVNFARRSRRRKLRDAIVPPPNVSSVVGPGYVASIEEFVAHYWNVDAALERSTSLQRCVTRLKELR